MPKRAWFWIAEQISRKRGALVFGGKFLAAMGALWLVALSSTYAWALAELTRANAAVCGGALRLAGLPVEVQGGTLFSPTFALTVIPACSGLEIWFFIVAAMLAFPSSWRAKLLGMGGALLAMLALNILRIVSLFLVGQFRPQDFDMAHFGLWPGVLNLAALGILGVWLAGLGALNRGAK